MTESVSPLLGLIMILLPISPLIIFVICDTMREMKEAEIQKKKEELREMVESALHILAPKER